MTATSACGRKAWRAASVTMAFACIAVLSGCGEIDNALFSGSASDEKFGEAPGAPPPSAPDEEGTEDVTLGPATSGMQGPAVTIHKITIAPGQPTGTVIGQKVQEVRASLLALEDRLEANAQKLDGLRQSAAAYSSTYNTAKANITSRLQIGTTRGNPELVAQWNTAQDALDKIAADINALNALGRDVTADEANAHFTLDTIRATYTVSGAVDEDHRQLHVLEDETSQTIVLVERLLTEVTRDIQRQTSYVANERANLTTLANAIKNGEIYGSTLGPSMIATGPAPTRARGLAGTPLVVIKFDRPKVVYQQVLYTALAQALERKPNAGFEVVAVAPSAGTASSVQLAQSETQRNAQAVMRSIGDMGVPSNRLAMSTTTDPSVEYGEVRVFVR